MKTTSLSAVLAAQPLFKELSDAGRDQLTGCARNVHFATGTRILHEGDPANEFFLLRRGRVALSVSAPGKGPIVIETLGPGEVLGWSWLLPPFRWHFDAEAIEDTGATMFDGACLRGKFDDDPGLGYELMRGFLGVVVERLQATRLRLLDLYAP